MLRGINHHTIFEDDVDFQRYLKTLMDYQEKLDYSIYAYCLMDNHVHLLIKEGSEELSKVFQTLAASFVYWYNKKYEREGQLFQGRFRSEAVDNDEYFLVVTRYIHQNPVKAGIVENAEDYMWSSYREYIGKPSICDIDFGLDIIDPNRQRALATFIKYNSKENQDSCLDNDQDIRLSDSEAREIIMKIGNIKSPDEAINLDKKVRTKLIKACKEEGIYARQISRLTGISRGIVKRI